MFNGNNLPHELLLTTRQKTKLRNAFENNMSTDIKFSNTQICKTIRSAGLLGSLLGKLGGPLMKVAVPVAKNILVPLGITAAASAIDTGIQKKIHTGSGTTTLIISNEEMNDISKITKAVKDFDIFVKEITKTIKNEAKEKKGGFLSMLLDTLASTLLVNMLTGGKGKVRAGFGSKQGEGIVRAGYCYSIKKKLDFTTSFNKLSNTKVL